MKTEVKRNLAVFVTLSIILVIGLLNCVVNAQTPNETVLKINFQPASTITPEGYLADCGEVFGSKNGYEYGWNYNHTYYTRERNVNIDKRLATFCHFGSGGKWEFSLPNGKYQVEVSIGDASYASTNTINVEGTNYWNAASLDVGAFDQQIKTVMVADGKLTVDAAGSPSMETKINYIEIMTLNLTPYAEAGIDKNTAANMLVVLDGGDSYDTDNLPGVLSYDWKQISGPVVTLNNSTFQTATFVPVFAGTYIFEMTVSDGELTSKDYITVNVNRVRGKVNLGDALIWHDASEIEGTPGVFLVNLYNGYLDDRAIDDKEKDSNVDLDRAIKDRAFDYKGQGSFSIYMMFPEPVTISSAKIHKYNNFYWSIYGANSLEDLANRSGSYTQLGNEVETYHGEASSTIAFEDSNFSLFRLEFRYKSRDIEINEIELQLSDLFQRALVQPRGIAIDSNNRRIIADPAQSALVVMDDSGDVIKKIGYGVLQEPYDVAVDSAGNYLVADKGLDKVLRLDTNGQIISVIAMSGTSNGSVTDPVGIAVDYSTGNERIYVLENSKYLNINRVNPIQRIQCFDKYGNYDANFGNSGALTEGRDKFNNPWSFNSPMGISLFKDSLNNLRLLVADTNNNCIQVFNASDGTFIETIGPVYTPYDVVTAKDGTAYVAGALKYNELYSDRGNLRIIKPDSRFINGHFYNDFGKIGSLTSGVAIDNSGKIIFSDIARARIHSYTPVLSSPADPPASLTISKGEISDLIISATDTSITVKYKTQLESPSIVYWGEEGFTNSAVDNSLKTDHSMVIQNLSPGKRYMISVGYQRNQDSKIMCTDCFPVRCEPAGYPNVMNVLRLRCNALIITGRGAAYIENNGKVIMEAENYTRKDPNDESVLSWVENSDTAGSSEDLAMGSSQNYDVDYSDSTSGPRLEYDVQFNGTGKYYLWVRMLGANSSDDSIHAGLDDNSPLTYGYDGLADSSGNWAWVNSIGGNRISVDVNSTGTHTIKVWMSEDGVLIDKIILTKDDSFIPSDKGPTQSEMNGQLPFNKSDIENARKIFKNTSEFYYRNSYGRIWLDFDRIEVVDKPVNVSGSWLSPWSDLIQDSLRELGYNADSNFDILIADATPKMVANFPDVFGGNAGYPYGLGSETGYVFEGTKRLYGYASIRGQNLGTMVHEMNHIVDGVYYMSNMEFYNHDHAVYNVDGNINPITTGSHDIESQFYGPDMSANSKIVRRMFIPNYTAVRDGIGEVIQVRDMDADGLGDSFVDAALNSSKQLPIPDPDPYSVDSDGDGLSDLVEIMNGFIANTDPHKADTDSDSSDQGDDVKDKNPLLDINGYIPKVTASPVIDGVINSGESWTTVYEYDPVKDNNLTNDSKFWCGSAQNIDTSGQNVNKVCTAWDDSAFYIAVDFEENRVVDTGEMQKTEVIIQVDGNGHGWFNGFENYLFKIRASDDDVDLYRSPEFDIISSDHDLGYIENHDQIGMYMPVWYRIANPHYISAANPMNVEYIVTRRYNSTKNVNEYTVEIRIPVNRAANFVPAANQQINLGLVYNIKKLAPGSTGIYYSDYKDPVYTDLFYEADRFMRLLMVDNKDSDGDGLYDGQEIDLGMNPGSAQ